MKQPRPGRATAGAAVLSLFPACLLAVALAQSPEDPLASLLRRAGEAVVRQARESVVIIGDERCEQRAFDEVPVNSAVAGTLPAGGGRVRQGQRRWHGELALVQIPSPGTPAVPWIEVRDVMVVDGQPLPDRDRRLAALFQRGQPMDSRRLRAIVEENARYNIGPVQRTVNAPTVPLLVLYPANQGRFAFTAAGVKKLDGMETTKVSFRETMSPTLIRTAGEGADMPSMGTLWVADGAAPARGARTR